MTGPTRLLDTVAAPVRATTEVSRSRFVCDLAPVADVAGAAAVRDGARRELHDARHHCSAWVLGAQGQDVRSHDDGEPAGTAGPPMLAVLQGAALTDVVAVVSRYFGGTLLGAGGLVRAYGEAVTAALAHVERRPRELVTPVRVAVGHAEAGRLEHHLRRVVAEQEAARIDVTYGAGDVTLTVEVARTRRDRLLAVLAELAPGAPVEVGEPRVVTMSRP